MQRVFKTGLFAALLFGGLSAPAQAALITTNPTITVGDKQFSDFTCQVTILGTAVPTSCAGVDVTASTLDGNYGLLFQVGGFVNTIGSTVDVLLSYTATVLDPNYRISDVHLTMNGAVTGTGFVNVTETVRAGALIVGQTLVQNPPPILDSTILLNGTFSSVRVTKDILLGVSGPGAGSAALSFVGQYLSQTRVPEPGSLALLGTAFFGWGVALRRRLKGAQTV
jgi:hypothetical protein